MVTATLLRNAIVEVLELRLNHVTGSYEQNTINFFHRLCVFISNINKDVALEMLESFPTALKSKDWKKLQVEMHICIFTVLGMVVQYCKGERVQFYPMLVINY